MIGGRVVGCGSKFLPPGNHRFWSMLANYQGSILGIFFDPLPVGWDFLGAVQSAHAQQLGGRELAPGREHGRHHRARGENGDRTGALCHRLPATGGWGKTKPPQTEGHFFLRKWIWLLFSRGAIARPPLDWSV